ncbi:12537_t:CDS:2 [Gigaspora margarita]|uniref:12537_t:CDS:1 n=1 Tax=Gigaspora margarita TaxID=4874 RepID=A0ABN7UWY4_GIGMA|nr:12537_t:CDS:2 [Gigaspora margarita]
MNVKSHQHQKKTTNNNSFKRTEIPTYEHADIAILAIATSAMTVPTMINSKKIPTSAM